MMKLLFRVIPAIAGAALATSASAAVMTFNDLPNGLSAGPSFVENGLKAGSERGPFFTSGGVMVGGPLEPQGQFFNFTLANGEAFTPISADLFRLTQTGRVFGNFLILGFDEFGDSVGVLDFDNETSRTVDLSSIGKVYRLRLTFYNDVGGIDNLTFTPANVSGVPEPSSWALLLIGFGIAGLGPRSQSRIRKAGQTCAAPTLR